MILLTVLTAVYDAFEETVSLKKEDEGVELIEFHTCVGDGEEVLVALELYVVAKDGDILPVPLPLAVNVTN